MRSVPLLAQVARRQDGVVTRAQLHELGVRPYHVTNQLRARRWQQVTRDVVVLHNGPVEGRALLWAAVLAAGRGAALCSWTALELRGLRGWGRPDVHVVVPRGGRPEVVTGVVVHESRRHRPDDARYRDGLPVHSAARAAVDAAAWSGSARTAVGVVAATVQQRLTTASEIASELDRAGRVRFHRLLAHSLADIQGGADSLAEIDFTQLCRRAGLPLPRRQARRTDARGRTRFLDVEWELPDGRPLLVEIDGIGHMEVERWYDDLLRTAELPLRDAAALIRLPATAARTEPDRVVAILRRHLEPA